MASSDEQSVSSTPEVPSVSPGSSVSTTLKEEYEDLLKYALVTPVLEPSMGGRATLRRPDASMTGASAIGSFRLPGSTLHANLDVTEVVKVPSSIEEDPTTATQPPHPTQHHPRNEYPPSDASSTEHGHHHEDGEELDLESVPLGAPPPASAPAVHSLAVPLGLQGGGEERDQELVQLEMQLDAWCGDMKRNILAEFAQCLLRLKQRMKGDLEGEKARYAHAMSQTQRELEGVKDLAATYEASIANKDQVIANLTGALQKQRSKCDLQSSFGQWKVHHVDVKREHFVTKMAAKHYARRLLLKVWCAWHGIIESRWKQSAEKACQSRAEEVCVQLTNEYEERLAVMQRSLDEARVDVQQMKAQRDLFADNMKKAFMRGVCALNMEAMTMFHSGGSGGGSNEGGSAEEVVGHTSDSDSTDSGPGTGNPHPQIPHSDYSHHGSNDPRQPVSIGVSFRAVEAGPHAQQPRVTRPPPLPRPSLQGMEPAPQRQTKGSGKQGGGTRKTFGTKVTPAVVIERHPQS